MEPDFDLGDVDAMTTEVGEATALGPAVRRRRDAVRRRPERAEAGRAVAPDGRPRRRPDRPPPRPLLRPAHWSAPAPGRGDWRRCSSSTSTEGIDLYDYSGPGRRTDDAPGRASSRSPAARAARRTATGAIFEAAALAHLATGVPILTHCEGGTGALEQLRLLTDLGVAPSHIAFSHVDKVVDRGYHRELLGERRVRRSTTSRSAGRDGATARSSSSSGPWRTAWTARSCWAWTPRGSGYYPVYGGAPGPDLAAGRVHGAMAERGLDETVRHRLFVDESGAGVRLRRRSIRRVTHDRPAPDQRRRARTPGRRGSCPGSMPPSAASSDRPTSPRCSTTPSTSRIRDQEEAGIDIVCDGEMRRAGFFTAEFYAPDRRPAAARPTAGWAPAATTSSIASRSSSRSPRRTASASSRSSATPGPARRGR